MPTRKTVERKTRLSLKRTSVHAVSPIGIDTEWHGECWSDFGEGELDVKSSRLCALEERGNIVDPEGHRYVTSGQRPEGRSRFTPWRSHFTPIGRLVPSLPDGLEVTGMQTRKVDQDPVCCEPSKSCGSGWLVSQKGKDSWMNRRCDT